MGSHAPTSMILLPARTQLKNMWDPFQGFSLFPFFLFIISYLFSFHFFSYFHHQPKYEHNWEICEIDFKFEFSFTLAYSYSYFFCSFFSFVLIYFVLIFSFLFIFFLFLYVLFPSARTRTQLRSMWDPFQLWVCISKLPLKAITTPAQSCKIARISCVCEETHWQTFFGKICATHIKFCAHLPSWLWKQLYPQQHKVANLTDFTDLIYLWENWQIGVRKLRRMCDFAK